MATKKPTPTWSDVKTKLADLDRAGPLKLLQDLHAASRDNQAFLHARFGLGEDVLKPCKATIMFAQALMAIENLPDAQRPSLWTRLEAVCRTSQDFGYGVGDGMSELLAEFGFSD
ncbi:hypothetical protein P3W85_28940 [Cupriavidus basilensis]|uniref:Uncharacterized protein n=1 Tax=Cupriavidus basilensis TaxID=68895 RepID=A0ABT6AWD8_9BURK|nr:hypothetical protein [Cupriavidus basilensis]MDF3836948.1 hypothetical protein [Cupriavidus basilensis]